MTVLTAILALILDIVPMSGAFLKPVHDDADTVLVGDRLRYGFRLENVAEGTGLMLPDPSSIESDTLAVFGGWKLDTLADGGRRGRKPSFPAVIEAGLEMAVFEEGSFNMGALPVLAVYPDRTDTLMFNPVEIEITPIQIDTATFVPADIKGQMTYPVTFAEVAPWALGGLLAAALAALAVFLIRRRIRATGSVLRKDPPHIVALRKLDKFRGNKYWAPDKQKTYYSGITDALKEYVDGRFGIDAPEMTTDELFAALKSRAELTPELYSELKTLFETADFVKFAKFAATDEQNSAALPLAVRFVTTTYETEEEAAQQS